MLLVHHTKKLALLGVFFFNFHSTHTLADCSTTQLSGSDVIECQCWDCPDPAGCTVNLYTHLAGQNPIVACNVCATGDYANYECQYSSSIGRRPSRQSKSASVKVTK